MTDDSSKLIATLEGSSDFTVVVVALSYLDACLGALLSKHLRKGSTADDLLDANRGALGPLATKAKVAYVLDLISKDFLQDILILAELRNSVAHSHLELNFSDTGVQAQCEKLSLLSKIAGVPPYEFLFDMRHYQDPRRRFIFTSVLIWGHILAISEDAQA